MIRRNAKLLISIILISALIIGCGNTNALADNENSSVSADSTGETIDNSESLESSIEDTADQEIQEKTEDNVKKILIFQSVKCLRIFSIKL